MREDKSYPAAKHLLEKGHEFGTTTGRERRCGWFDIQSAKHSIMTNGFNKIAIMKLDVLDGMKEINDNLGHDYGDKALIGASKISDITDPGCSSASLMLTLEPKLEPITCAEPMPK